MIPDMFMLVGTLIAVTAMNLRCESCSKVLIQHFDGFMTIRDILAYDGVPGGCSAVDVRDTHMVTHSVSTLPGECH